MLFIYALLFLLAGSIVLGIIRKLGGGSFLPEPEPGEDRHVMDKRGRWWREQPDGVLEEAFRRSPNTPPLYRTLLKGFAYYVLVCVVLAAPFLIITGIGLLLTGERFPFWVEDVIAIACDVLILWYARRRGWW